MTVALPIALALLLGACSGGASGTPAGSPSLEDCARVDDGVITISAQNLEFNVPCMVANAGEAFTIHFVNQEAVPHDVAVYREEAKTNEIMRGEVILGPAAEIDYEVEALDAGEYYFLCTIHPEMDGTLYVEGNA
ncbi:MAG TPA: cupredoxin domain-containing protein [Candidatus Limnocylindria bacterium]